MFNNYSEPLCMTFVDYVILINENTNMLECANAPACTLELLEKNESNINRTKTESLEIRKKEIKIIIKMEEEGGSIGNNQ